MFCPFDGFFYGRFKDSARMKGTFATQTVELILDRQAWASVEFSWPFQTWWSSPVVFGVLDLETTSTQGSCKDFRKIGCLPSMWLHVSVLAMNHSIFWVCPILTYPDRLWQTCHLHSLCLSFLREETGFRRAPAKRTNGQLHDSGLQEKKYTSWAIWNLLLAQVKLNRTSFHTPLTQVVTFLEIA
jgi:hypothetical protein